MSYIPTSHLRPFRDYNEKDVINFYTLSGVPLPVGNGVLVAITGAGFVATGPDVVEMIGDYAQGPGQTSFLNNVVAQRYGALPKITFAQSGVQPLGLTLFDCTEFDENGEPLRYNPRKAAEIEAVISGQAMPVVTKGVFRISGFDVTANLSNLAGQAAYAGANGLITTQTGAGAVVNYKIGTFLGNTGSDGSAIVRINL